MKIAREAEREAAELWLGWPYWPVKNADGCIWGLPSLHIVVVQSLSHVWLFATPWTAAHQASLSFTISWSLFNQTHVHWVGDAIQPIYKLRKAKEWCKTATPHCLKNLIWLPSLHTLPTDDHAFIAPPCGPRNKLFLLAGSLYARSSIGKPFPRYFAYLSLPCLFRLSPKISEISPPQGSFPDQPFRGSRPGNSF